jgi:hypothetical protein
VTVPLSASTLTGKPEETVVVVEGGEVVVVCTGADVVGSAFVVAPLPAGPHAATASSITRSRRLRFMRTSSVLEDEEVCVLP